MSSDPRQRDSFTISARLLKNGGMSPLFWRDDILNKEIKVMGPMGFNTSNKLGENKIFLFAFGIGVSVIKSIASEMIANPEVKELFIVTGNTNEDEILYKDFLDNLWKNNEKVTVQYVLSKPKNLNYPYTGHIQDFIEDFDFDNSGVYICGSTKACESLKEKIESMKPENSQIIVEAFG